MRVDRIDVGYCDRIAIWSRRHRHSLASPLWKPGVAVFLVYLGLTWRFPLLTHVQHPLQDMGRLTDYDPGWAAATFIAFSAAFAAYWMGYRHLRTQSASPMTWKLVLGLAGLFNLVLLFMYPVGAADIFDNIVRGRMIAVYRANPLIYVPSQFPADPFVRYAAWADYRSAYGPLWETIAAATAWLAGDGVLSNVLLFKGVAIAAYAVDVVLIQRILNHIAPARALQGVYLFAWNPLVLFTIAGNGHNDSVMLLTVLLALYLYVTRRYTAAILALMAGVLIKFFPAALIPLLVAGGLRQVGKGQRRDFLLRSLGGSLALGALFYLLFWGSADPFNLTQRNTLFTTSLPALAQIALAPHAGKEAAGRMVNLIAAGVLGAFVLYQARHLATRGATTPHAIGEAMYKVTLFYLLVTCPWLQPWYLVWAFGLVALLANASLIRGATLFAYTLSWKYILYAFFFGAMDPLMPRPPRELIAFGVVLALPLLYHAWTAWIQRDGVHHANSGYHPYLQ